MGDTTQMETQQIKKRGSSKLMTIIFSLVFAGLLLVGVAELLMWNGVVSKTTLSDVDKDGYQAVFLNNGQVYFGKLQTSGSEYLKLSDVWYLRASETDSKSTDKIQQSSGDSANATIIKLGNEIHGPKDAMLISKSQVLFYENLKDDGKVVKAIKDNTK